MLGQSRYEVPDGAVSETWRSIQKLPDW